jgi:hypothetical protein
MMWLMEDRKQFHRVLLTVTNHVQVLDRMGRV